MKEEWHRHTFWDEPADYKIYCLIGGRNKYLTITFCNNDKKNLPKVVIKTFLWQGFFFSVTFLIKKKD